MMRYRYCCFFLIVGVLISTVCAIEPLPLYFQTHYGDARDELATSARLYDVSDPAWQVKPKLQGDFSGQTSVTVEFAQPAIAFPVRFTLPLGHVPSSKNVAIFDESGRPIPADVFALVNFDACPEHWVMVATVLDAPHGGQRRLTVRWGPDVTRPKQDKIIQADEKAGQVDITGGKVAFSLSSRDLLSNIRRINGQQTFASKGSQVGFCHDGKEYSQSEAGKVIRLFDGPLYKRFRIVSSVMEPQVKLHFEVETWRDSPYLMIHSRLINEQRAERHQEVTSFVELNNLQILGLQSDDQTYQISVGGVQSDGQVFTGDHELVVAQRSYPWLIFADGREVARNQWDALGEWIRLSQGNEALTLIAPHFQGYGPGDPDLESQMIVRSDGSAGVVHYKSFPADANGTVKLWESAARTFPLVLHVGDESESANAVALAAKRLPIVKLDRDWVTRQGVLHEDRVTHVYDQPSLEGARYFDRERVERQDYPRAGRGMPPPKGEGFEHPYTDTGGMLFGEVWQYTDAFPNVLKTEAWFARAREPEGNLPLWYKIHNPNGYLTYRCGDHSYALASSYLRTGDRQVFEILKDHSLLYADWAIAHPTGWCHYYCGWTSATRVYVRLSGPLMCYLVLGEPWLFEVGEQMGGFLVNDWSEARNSPPDGQTRSVYTARGLCKLYEITGHPSYWHNAVDRTIFSMKADMNEKGQVYGYHYNKPHNRITELFAGYVMAGLCAVCDRCENPDLLAAIQRTGDWLIDRQSKPGTPEAIGGWCRDEVCYGRSHRNFGPGNCGAMTLCASLETWLADRTGEQKYFYSGAAAWANLVTSTHHEGLKGGMPMQMGDKEKIGTWSDKLPVYLHQLGAVAAKNDWPFVVEGVYNGSKGPQSPVVVFVDKGGQFDGTVYHQPMYAANENDVQIPVWCPQTPIKVMYNDKNLSFQYEPQSQITMLTLPGKVGSGILVMEFEP